MAGAQFLVVASLNMLGDAYNAFEYHPLPFVFRAADCETLLMRHSAE